MKTGHKKLASVSDIVGYDEKKGEARGKEIGEAIGEARREIKGSVEMCQNFGKSISETVAILIQKFGMTEEASVNKVAQYWKS